MLNFNNIICRLLTVGCLIDTYKQQHQLAATTRTDSSRRQQHQQAAGSKHVFARHYRLYEFLNIHIQYITTLSDCCSLTV